MVPYKFKIIFSISVKSDIGILIEIVLKLLIIWGSMDILTTLITPIMNVGIFSFICVLSYFLFLIFFF